MSRLRIPRAEEIMIFFSRLDPDPTEPAGEYSELSTSESKRAERLPEGLARNRFIAGRLFLRNTLASLLDLEPNEISLKEGKWGKPRLANSTDDMDLTFNLSHSADHAVLAVCGGVEVGVDLERVATDVPCLELARLFFSAREFKELMTLTENEQLEAFFRCWTRKEAYMKGCGRGLSLPPDAFDVTLLPDAPPLLLDNRTFPAHKERWRICDLAAPQGFIAALAVEARGFEITYVMDL